MLLSNLSNEESWNFFDESQPFTFYLVLLQKFFLNIQVDKLAFKKKSNIFLVFICGLENAYTICGYHFITTIFWDLPDAEH